MRSLLMIATLAVGAAAQLPCLIDTSRPGYNGWNHPIAQRPDVRVPVHIPHWESRPAYSTIRDINAGTAIVAGLITMPVAGTCSGSFESRNNQDDATKVAIDAAGRYTHIRPPQPGDDVEIFVVDAFGWEAFRRNLNPTLLATTGRSFGGDFDFSLPAGTFYIVINNRYSTFASKQVKLTIGRDRAP